MGYGCRLILTPSFIGMGAYLGYEIAGIPGAAIGGIGGGVLGYIEGKWLDTPYRICSGCEFDEEY